MGNAEFEKAFGEFLERKEYDQAESALFSMVRIAFVAGWLAAGGAPSKPQNIIEIFHKTETSKNYIETDIVLGENDN